MDMLEKFFGFFRKRKTEKGSAQNPYESWEFPRNSISGATRAEVDRLEEVWRSNPQIWQDREQPDWDMLFDLAEV